MNATAPQFGNIWGRRPRGPIMRSFLAACVVAIAVAIAAAFILDNFVQESAKAAFALPSVRV